MSSKLVRLATLATFAFAGSLLLADEAPTVYTANGLVQAPGVEWVQAHCGACHSLSLVTQNRGDERHWLNLIRWMQDKHNLWDLGPAEPEIIAYLAAHYGAPDLVPRRAPLETQWRDANQ